MTPLLQLENEAAYRAHFEKVYCKNPIITFDGIAVRLRKSDFDHCCYKTERGGNKKTVFCPIRAARIDWIQIALKDPNADLRVGWDNIQKRHRPNRRVAIIFGTYVVIIDILKCRKKARLVTTFVADSGPGKTLTNIKRSPKWPRIQT
ncbi:MAG: hypothetical protein LAT58_01180 [Opitutales bacterium]|nr:hypothetical protein [Opitutales bacterium]